MTEKPELIYDTYIRTTPDELWTALTEPSFTRQYFHETEVRSSWEKGAAVVYEYPDGRPAVDGEVLDADRPRLLSITWHPLYDADLIDERPSRVTFSITPMGPACRLRVVHDRFEHTDGVYQNVRLGWFYVLDGLKTLLETGAPLVVAEV